MIAENRWFTVGNGVEYHDRESMMNIADPERTAGTGLTESVLLTCDPDNPVLRPSDEQIDDLLRIANQYVPRSVDYFEYQRAAVREWLAKIAC